MAKKKDEKDVLVVRDEKTGEISVVAGLNADGTPKRTPAKAENAQSFLQFDRHATCWTTSSRTSSGSARNPAASVSTASRQTKPKISLEVMKQLLKDPEANKELLAPHKVDTSAMRRRCRKRWQHNRQRNKNLKNRRTWNNRKNRTGNRNRRRANGATSPSTRAKSTGRSWRTDGA